MRKNLYKKFLAFTVIVLFVAIGALQSISINGDIFSVKAIEVVSTPNVVINIEPYE
jgi:hypothetical protein